MRSQWNTERKTLDTQQQRYSIGRVGQYQKTVARESFQDVTNAVRLKFESEDSVCDLATLGA
jgi:hypothetical protein